MALVTFLVYQILQLYKRTVDTTRPQRMRMTQEYPERGSEERTMDGGLQVQLEKDRSSSTRQSWMESSGLWFPLHC